MALIREALELAAGSAQIRLHLNPEDHKALGGQVRVAGERDVRSWAGRK